jgi:hypothetical protein
VAERERLSNKERKAQARAERKRREEEAAKKAKRNQVRNGLITAAVVAVVAAVLLQAFLGGPDTLEDEVLVASSAVEEGRDAAGCEVLVEGEPLPDSSHFEANQTPPLDSIYPDIRPTHSGPHTVQTYPVVDASSSQIDEAASTHNLEHGAIIAWYDPEQVDGDVVDEMASWAETLNESGFRSQGGGGIMVSPYDDPGISSGQAIALRAWGVAMDCDDWNEDVAHGFVIDHYGTHGIAPERPISPFPDGTLAYSDREVEDTEEDEAPVEDRMEGESDVDPDEVDDDAVDAGDDAGDEDDADDDGDDADQ